jgi:hypothetical protein
MAAAARALAACILFPARLADDAGIYFARIMESGFGQLDQLHKWCDKPHHGASNRAREVLSVVQTIRHSPKRHNWMVGGFARHERINVTSMEAQ